MTKATSRHMIVLDFGHQTGLHTLPFTGSFRRPPTGPTWRLSREPFASHVLELARQFLPFVIGNSRRETDMIKSSFFVEQAEQQRTYDPLSSSVMAGSIAEATDNAVG